MRYAIETRNLNKSFRGMYAVNGLDMHVPEGAIYGFIGEDGSGKSTTEKLICGLLVPGSGSEIRLYGRPHTDAEVRSRMGVLIENPGCFPNSTVYQNLFMQAMNLGLANPSAEIERVLKLVRINREEGATILISSHILGELAKIATHYGVLREGRLVREVFLKRLRRRPSGRAFPAAPHKHCEGGSETPISKNRG